VTTDLMVEGNSLPAGNGVSRVYDNPAGNARAQNLADVAADGRPADRLADRPSGRRPAFPGDGLRRGLARGDPRRMRRCGRCSLVGGGHGRCASQFAGCPGQRSECWTGRSAVLRLGGAKRVDVVGRRRRLGLGGRGLRLLREASARGRWSTLIAAPQPPYAAWGRRAGEAPARQSMCDVSDGLVGRPSDTWRTRPGVSFEIESGAPCVPPRCLRRQRRGNCCRGR